MQTKQPEFHFIECAYADNTVGFGLKSYETLQTIQKRAPELLRMLEKTEIPDASIKTTIYPSTKSNHEHFARKIDLTQLTNQ